MDQLKMTEAQGNPELLIMSNLTTGSYLERGPVAVCYHRDILTLFDLGLRKRESAEFWML